MQQLFSAIPATAHSYLFEFDRHVRLCLATSNCKLLSDTSWYEDYCTTYVTQAAAAPQLDLIPNSSGSMTRSNQASSASRQSQRSVPYCQDCVHMDSRKIVTVATFKYAYLF